MRNDDKICPDCGKKYFGRGQRCRECEETYQREQRELLGAALCGVALFIIMLSALLYSTRDANAADWFVNIGGGVHLQSDDVGIDAGRLTYHVRKPPAALHESWGNAIGIVRAGIAAGRWQLYYMHMSSVQQKDRGFNGILIEYTLFGTRK